MSDIIDKVRQAATKGWGPPNIFTSADNQKWDSLWGQKAAYIFALTFIADEAKADDINTIKELARIALGREWNKDGSPVESKEGE